ncbi:MAG: replicative DNA helicase [Candidatus Hatepunaea meridiana]|nr:replicative DNA helicase [Candidatus Hatepunaea meridiana]
MPNENKSSGTPTKTDSSIRVPPHNLEIERALLCSALIDPNGYHQIVGIVIEKSFYDRRHRLIFEAMKLISDQSGEIDVLTVSEQLERMNNLEAAGGDPYIAGLSTEIVTSAHIKQYAKIIQEHSSLRSLISAGTRMVNEAYDTGDVKELLDHSMQELFEISEGRQEGGFTPIKPVLTDLHTHIDALHSRPEGSLTGIDTGFKKLNEMTSGFQDGDLIVIAARPSMGKTAFALDMARHAALVKNIPVAFFSLEMSSTAIAMRLIAAEGRLDLHKLRSGRLPDRDCTELSLSTGRLSEIPFFIDDSSALGVTEIRARARLLKQKHHIGILFIDYLGLMDAPKALSREQEVAKISRALKGLARELNIPVVAMSQLSRAIAQRGEDARPQLTDLRDSGAIEQDADLVMFIHRHLYKRDRLEKEIAKVKKKKFKSEITDDEAEKEIQKIREGIERIERTAEVIIRKQRNGPIGKIDLMFLKTFATFEGQASESDIEQAETDEYSSIDDDYEDEKARF